MTIREISPRLGRYVLMLAAGALLLGLAACYPGGPENASDTDLVATVKGADTDYSNLQTYFIDEHVYDLVPPGEPYDPLPQQTKDRIISNLKDQMEAAGFEEVAEDAAQVKLIAGAVLNEVWYYYYGWGGYYYYPVYPTVSSFEVGSVLWQMLDLRDIAPDEEPETIWFSGLTGVLSNTTSSNWSRLDSNMAQAFTQSPYIQAAPATR